MDTRRQNFPHLWEGLSTSGFISEVHGDGIKAREAGLHTLFHSRRPGNSSDNPWNPVGLNTKQKNATVSMMFGNVSSWEVTFMVPVHGHALFYLAGATDLIPAETMCDVMMRQPQ